MRTLWISSALALLAAVAASSAGATTSASLAGRTITVNGVGIVTTVPDQASFSFGVTVTARTARAALSANARRMSSLIAVIKKQGIADRDIQTAEISLSPNTNDNGTKILNFTATNTVSVTTKAIARAGSIVDAAVAAGANTISGPTLTPSGQLLLERHALTAAIADARARALTIATAAHVRLGAVRTVTEVSSSPVTFSPSAKSSALSSTPVEAGSVQTEEDVTVTFAIA
ncbi:MAG TPA: SIMPL domain-containing protein [Gaiellaceae bacterium]